MGLCISQCIVNDTATELEAELDETNRQYYRSAAEPTPNKQNNVGSSKGAFATPSLLSVRYVLWT